MYSEQRTFGSTWIRLYFTVKRGKLEAPENKAKAPISLPLKLCSVKLAEPTDSERNFCFKVISPTRVVLLQAENSMS
jgi:Arf-GAP/coiled-coil/ANK repeat/PH domain-containing protein